MPENKANLGFAERLGTLLLGQENFAEADGGGGDFDVFVIIHNLHRTFDVEFESGGKVDLVV